MSLKVFIRLNKPMPFRVAFRPRITHRNRDFMILESWWYIFLNNRTPTVLSKDLETSFLLSPLTTAKENSPSCPQNGSPMGSPLFASQKRPEFVYIPWHYNISVAAHRNTDHLHYMSTV